MARPTDKIRIQTLTPDQITELVEERIDAYVGRLSFALGIGGSLCLDRHEGTTSDLAMTAQALLEYAQRGLPVWDWETHGEAEDACHSLVSTLYGCPAEMGRATSSNVGPLAEDEELDLDDPLDLVVVAAWARVELSKSRRITARQLAALAGLDQNSVRRLAREGEITLDGDRPAVAKAKEARRWLKARGVQGVQ